MVRLKAFSPSRGKPGEGATMSALDNHDSQRHDRFLMAEVSVTGHDEVHQIQVRNLSAGGMMGEGAVAVDRGSQLHIEMPNLGSIAGTVAWTQGSRFGVAFAEDIDPNAVFGKAAIDCDDGNPDDGGVSLDRRSETRLH